MRHNSSHRPVLQSMSTQNHRVERLWPEINQRINYPIKRILVMMESAGKLDLSNDKDNFSVSWVTITVLSHPLSEFVQAWNHHRIVGSSGGIPIRLARNNNGLTPIPSTAVPQTNQAIDIFRQKGGHLTPESTFGRDLINSPRLQILHTTDFNSRYPVLTLVFENVLHGDGALFKSCILHNSRTIYLL